MRYRKIADLQREAHVAKRKKKQRMSYRWPHPRCRDPFVKMLEHVMRFEGGYEIEQREGRASFTITNRRGDAIDLEARAVMYDPPSAKVKNR